jgi:hypothetical protein
VCECCFVGFFFLIYQGLRSHVLTLTPNRNPQPPTPHSAILCFIFLPSPSQHSFLFLFPLTSYALSSSLLFSCFYFLCYCVFFFTFAHFFTKACLIHSTAKSTKYYRGSVSTVLHLLFCGFFASVVFISTLNSHLQH